VFWDHHLDAHETWRILGAEMDRRSAEQGIYVSSMWAAPLASIELARAATPRAWVRALAGIPGAFYVTQWTPGPWIGACALLALTAGIVLADSRRAKPTEPEPRAGLALALALVVTLGFAPLGAVAGVNRLEAPRRLRSDVVMRLERLMNAEQAHWWRTSRGKGASPSYVALEDLVKANRLEPQALAPLPGYAIEASASATAFQLVATPTAGSGPSYAALVASGSFMCPVYVRRSRPIAISELTQPLPTDLETTNSWDTYRADHWVDGLEEPWIWLGKAP
jgi:hypothetical protein